MNNTSSPSKISWGLVLAIAMLCGTVYLLSWALSLHADPWKAAAFANAEVSRRGYDWPRVSFDDDGRGSYHGIYLAPDDSGRRLDVKVQRGTNDDWQVVTFKEWVQKWESETASR